MQVSAGLKSSELWLNVATVVLTALSAFPNPVVAACAVALSAVYTLARTYVKTKQVDMAAIADAAAKVKAAAAVVVEPKFDANVFGAMTADEKAAAVAKK